MAWRSLSSRLRNRSVKSFAFEVMCVQLSFQTPPVPRRGIQRRQVVLALARHLQARLPQGGDDIGPIPYRAVLDTLEQVVADQVAGGRFERETGPQLRRLDVGAVPGLLRPRPRRIIRPAPALFGVEGVAERVECLLPARRRDVEAPAGLQVASRGEDMHVNAAVALAMHHGRPGVAVGLEPRPGRLFKGIDDRADLRVGRSVVRCPGNHARRVLVLERQRVGHRRHLMGIPPEDLDPRAQLPGRVPCSEEIVGRRPG